MVLPSAGFGEELPPSDYVVKRRGLMIALLILQMGTSCTRFFDFGVPHTVDTVGGIFCLVGCIIGWLAVINHMDLQFLMYWGLFSLYLALMELIKLVQLSVFMAAHADPEHRVFIGKSRSVWENVAGFCYVACPAMFFCGTIMAWNLYMNYSDCDYYDNHGEFDEQFLERSLMASGHHGERRYTNDAADGDDGENVGLGGRTQSRASHASERCAPLQPFAGPGRRLASSSDNASSGAGSDEDEKARRMQEKAVADEKLGNKLIRSRSNR